MKFPAILASQQSIAGCTNENSELSALICNAVSGMLIVAASKIYFLSLMSPLLYMAEIILFGPLVGFIISSLFARSEWLIFRRHRPDYSLFYRLSAWSSLPVAFSILAATTISLLLETYPLAAYVCGLLVLVLTALSLHAHYSYLSNLPELGRSKIPIRLALSIILCLFFMAALIAGLGFIISISTGENFQLAEIIGGLK